MKRWLVAALALGFALADGPARGDERDLVRAKEIAEEARRLVSQGDYVEAAKAYAEAFRLVPNAVVKYNEAESWHAAAMPAPAADAYEHALKMDTLDAERTARSKKRLAELERSLGVLVIEEPRGGTVSVGHAVSLRLPARIHLPPGAHAVSVTSPDRRHYDREVSIVAGSAEPLLLPTSQPPKPKVEPKPPREESNGAQRIVGFVSLGLGAAAGIASVVVGGIFLGKLDKFEDGGRRDADLRDETVTLQAWTSGTAIAGGVLTALGTLLVLTAPNGEEISTALVPVPGGATVQFRAPLF